MNVIERIRSTLTVITMLVVAALPCFSSELAVLKNGFSIKHERREVIGSVTRLFTSADRSSYVDVPTSEIEHFETVLEDPAPTFPGPNTSLPAPSADVTRSLNFPARPVTDLNQVVNEASGRYQLDPDLVNSVIKAESGFKVRAVSPKGAQGLMQLMPGTATQLGVPNAFDPQANVEGGTKYLRELLEKYNFDMVKALAAYNAGPQRVERFGGVPPYSETKQYVRRIVIDFNKKKAAQQKAQAAKTTSTKKTAARGQANQTATNARVQAKAGQPSE